MYQAIIKKLHTNYESEYNVSGIINDIDRLLEKSFIIPLTVKSYEFFKSGNMVGIDLNCFLQDDEKIVMDNYRTTVWFNIYKK